MKKNLLTVIILALVLVNLILTAVLAFSVIPQTKKSNELIDQVCAAINIELEGGQNKDSSAVPICSRCSLVVFLIRYSSMFFSLF